MNKNALICFKILSDALFVVKKQKKYTFLVPHLLITVES